MNNIHQDLRTIKEIRFLFWKEEEDEEEEEGVRACYKDTGYG